MKSIKKTNFVKIIFSCFFLLTFVSCSSITPYKVPILQGNIFEEDDIEKLVVGLTKDQVNFIFGTALIQDPFHSSRWDYYYSIQVGNNLLEQKKLSISFNEFDQVDSWIIENLSD